MADKAEGVLAGSSIRLHVRVRPGLLGQPSENHGDSMAQLSLSMDEEGDAFLVTTEQSRTEEMVLEPVARMRTLTWSNTIDGAAVADPQKITDIAFQLVSLLEEVHNGHSLQCFPDRNGHDIGVLSSHARDQARRITDFMSECDWTIRQEVWAAEDWLESSDWADLASDAGVTPDAEDSIATIEAFCISTARDDNILLFELTEFLQNLRKKWLAENA